MAEILCNIMLLMMLWVCIRILMGKVEFRMPDLNIKLFDIVDNNPPEVTEEVASFEVSVKEDREAERAERKAKKEEERKKRKELANLKEECVLALRSLGVKKSDAPKQVERVFKDNGNINSVQEFLETLF